MSLAPDLHVHSTFSTLDGLGTPENVVDRAVELGWSAACLSEHGWMGSAPFFYQACRAKGINPILGCEMYVVPHEELYYGEFPTPERKAFSKFHLTVLALSREGYENLVAWTTFSSQRDVFYNTPRISLDAMAEVAPWPLHHNVVLSGCLGSELAVTTAEQPGQPSGPAYVAAMKSLFPNFYIEVQDHAHSKFQRKGFTAYDEMVDREAIVRNRLLDLARATGTPAILTNDSHFQSAKQRQTHLILTAQKRGERVGEARIAQYLPNYQYFTNYLRPMEAIADGLPAGFADQVIGNANDIASEADIRLDPLDNFKYSIPNSGYVDPIARIRTRCKSRLHALVGRHGDAAEDRFENELAAMGDFAHYLLLMSDFIIAARGQGILTNTRGSAASSLLCYCLRIHDVDSLEYGLTFQRFFNPMRKKLPDIDIDIEDDRYEDFMKIVKERMAELEGENQVLPISTYNTLANRSAFRLVAENLGVTKEQIDEISKLLPQMIDSGMVDEEDAVYESLKSDFPEIYDLASGVFDSIKSISQHACGWVFGTKDRPLVNWVPLVLIASSGVQVTAYNLKSVEQFGLVKGDFLRLKSLSVIKQTLSYIGQDVLDLENIPLDDPETFEMLRKGKTEGVFTLQGKENRRGCMECEVETIHDVIASVAIYRPALTRPGYHRVYNARRKGAEVEYPGEIAERVLGPTYGLPVFQDQILEIGYAMGMNDLEVEEFLQAIKTSKGVGRGAKEAFQNLKPMFYKFAKRVMPRDDADGLWELITSFEGYGFNKPHATSYGRLAVRSGYLKCHHTLEFFTALLNKYPNKGQYLSAARSDGFKFLPPDVNESAAGFNYDRASGKIRVGLAKVASLGPVAINEIIQKRPFSSLEDFRERCSARAVNKTRVESLALIGALSPLGVSKERDDVTEFQLCGFTIDKPRALRNRKPRHVSPRVSDRWVHRGQYRGTDYTDYKQSVSKLFWIPPVGQGRATSPLQQKASSWARTKTFLLLALDENGIPFEIMAGADKHDDIEILKYLAERAMANNGIAVCIDGAVRPPFLANGPLGFRMYGLTGSYNKDIQLWIDGKPKLEEKVKLALGRLSRRR